MADDAAEFQPPWPREIESGMTYSLTAPGAFATLLAGCGAQQATRLHGNSCAILWDRLDLGLEEGRQPSMVQRKHPAECDVRDTLSNGHDNCNTDGSAASARAVSHSCVPTHVLEVAVAPFLPVSVAVIGVCPILGSPDDASRAQLFVPPFDESTLLLPRIVALPAEALHAAGADTATDADRAFAWPRSIEVIEHDPWRRFATTACLHATATASASSTTVNVEADAVADTLAEIAAVAPFVTTLNLGKAARSVRGDFSLSKTAVAGLSYVKTIECDHVAVSFLRALMFQLNNERGPGAVTADGSITPAARKASGTQVEQLRVFDVTGTVEDSWVNDDYSNLTSIDGLRDGRVLLYFVRSCRHSLRSFSTGFGEAVRELLEAAREEGILLAVATAEGAAVESIGTLLPAATSVCVIESELEKGFFASLTDRKILSLSVDDCLADADDFLDFCRHAAKPMEHCTDLDFRTTTFAPEVVAAALPFVPSLQRFSCGGHGVNHGALCTIAAHRLGMEAVSIVGLADEPEGPPPEDTAAVLSEIVSRPLVRSVNLFGCPLTADDITAMRASKPKGNCNKMGQLRVMAADVYDQQDQDIDRDTIEGLVPHITYDHAERALQLPADLRAHLAAISPPLSVFDAETSLSGDLEYVAAHRLQTQPLPPPLTILASSLGPSVEAGCEQPTTDEPTASKVASITAVVWGNIDVVVPLPLGVHIGSGRMPLLREVALGGPAAVLFAVVDHCPLLETLSWVLPRGSGNPLTQWCFGSTVSAFSPVEDLAGAVQFVEATPLAHRPACSRTLASLTLNFYKSDCSTDPAPDDEDDQHEEDGDAVSDDEEASHADDLHVGADDSHVGAENSEGTSSRQTETESVERDGDTDQIVAISCAMFVRACPSLTHVALRDCFGRGAAALIFQMIPTLLNATVADGRRACDFSY